MGRLAHLFRGRFPDARALTGVCAVSVALIYSWTMMTSFYKLPSWALSLSVGQIASLYAYALVADLVESTLVVIGAVALECTLFAPFGGAGQFLSRASVLLFVGLSSAMARLLLYRRSEASAGFVSGEAAWWAVTVALGAIAAILVPRSTRLRRAVEGAAERLVVLLYLYIPLSVASVIVVLLRNGR